MKRRWGDRKLHSRRTTAQQGYAGPSAPETSRLESGTLDGPGTTQIRERRRMKDRRAWRGKEATIFA